MGGSRFYRSFSLYCVIHWSKLPSQETGERRIKIRTGKGPRDADCVTVQLGKHCSLVSHFLSPANPKGVLSSFYVLSLSLLSNGDGEKRLLQVKGSFPFPCSVIERE